MRLSYISFISFVICLSSFQGVLGKNEKTSSKRGEKEAFTRRGQLSTKQNHECSWEISGDQRINFTLTCSQKGVNSYSCTYEGEPQRSPSYSTKAKLYWKHIFGKLKKVKNACDEKTLKSRICKKAAAVESQLTKVGAGVGKEDEPLKTKGKSATKQNGKGKEELSIPPEANEDITTEQKSNSKKRKPNSKSNEKNPPTASSVPELSTAAREVNDDIVELNDDLAETYCAEKWHSVCSFFVNFWNG
ncbi:hypothetical protein GDO86_013261 [Hymenochirus boettgeri]|uniref:Fibroblast growth factor binding protein 1 n=1 Tax=Hymenochirus boettgeri TaxID=247094 RepID=A0A8T2IXR5_9PIPI|nr:hypothetical protein GDO86_013261 [Hymenochirus boettgeri]